MPKENKVFNYTIISLIVFISLSFIFLGVAYISSNLVLTVGTVMFDDLVCIPIENTTLYDCSFSVRYKITDNDGTIKYLLARVNNIIGPRVRLGDKVYIQYDPNDYTKVIYGNTSFKTYGLLYLTIGTILMLLACYYWNNLKR